VATIPDQLDVGRHRDASGRRELAARWVVLGLLTALVTIALLNGFGQRSGTVSAVGDDASLEIRAPARVRGGLFYQGRFTIESRGAIERPVLVLEPGWLDGITVNTIEPAPADEASRDGDLALTFGPLAAGDRLVVYMEFQVNPTTVGRRSADVRLLDGETPLVSVERTVTIFP
jgi:hypothetical protein